MIRRVIFDIDNTLIDWKSEYDNKVEEVLEKYYIKKNKEEVQKLKKAFDEYENYYLIFNLDNMIKFIREYTNEYYSSEVIKSILEEWGNCVPNNYPDENVEILKYLKSKYELVILTDWFYKPQFNRLKLLNIDTFFDKIYTAEKTKRKPNKEAFIQAIGKYKPEECVMIGDSYERDILGAINFGISAIWYKGEKEKIESLNDKIEVIQNLSELRNIL